MVRATHGAGWGSESGRAASSESRCPRSGAAALACGSSLPCAYWHQRLRCRPSFGAGVSFTISSRAGIADADFLVLPPSAASNSLSVFSCIVCVLQSCLHRRGFRRGAVRARESFRCWKLTAGVIRIAIRKVIFGGRLTSSSTA
ncbi:unnamed protein product [Prorocentrum cordatum]|uniref:Uncharacterized protein n=1 Tax=Prorocentrum cordatum TaxID=2364126 RepID=A0ABN9XY57_9DINO|nr:unnamed protein product [Polarella glacialis]